MNQFNHDLKKIYLAIGISESRKDELEEIVKTALKETKCNSEWMEHILNNGFSVVESLYAGYIMGQVVEKQTRRSEGNRGSIGAKLMGPNGVQDIPDEIAEKLYNLLKGFKPDLDEPD